MINDYITLELTDLDGNVVYFCENKFIVLTAKKDIDGSRCCFINNIYVDHSPEEVWGMIKYKKDIQDKSNSSIEKVTQVGNQFE